MALLDAAASLWPTHRASIVFVNIPHEREQGSAGADWCISTS